MTTVEDLITLVRKRLTPLENELVTDIWIVIESARILSSSPDQIATILKNKLKG
jgi:1,2-phenylacetyl-CoA epoxidase PaaB subunit